MVCNAIEVHIWSYYGFSKYLSVWGRVLPNDKTKHRSQSSPKDDMRVALSIPVPRISDIVSRKQAQKSQWVAEWLKLFVILQWKKGKRGCVFLLPSVFAPWFRDMLVHMKLFLEFQQPQETTSYKYSCLLVTPIYQSFISETAKLGTSITLKLVPD